MNETFIRDGYRWTFEELKTLRSNGIRITCVDAAYKTTNGGSMSVSLEHARLIYAALSEPQ
jgi:hypothetical protein